jgi:hypothetical protein
MAKSKSSNSKPVHTMGVISFVISVLGIYSAFVIPFLMQIIALILGHLALKDFNKNEGVYSGKGFIIASLVISYVIVALYVLFTLFLGAGLSLFLHMLAK